MAVHSDMTISTFYQIGCVNQAPPGPLNSIHPWSPSLTENRDQDLEEGYLLQFMSKAVLSIQEIQDRITVYLCRSLTAKV